MENIEEAFSAFYSYAHINDKHDGGRLSILRERLQMEIWVQMPPAPVPFLIFQDTKDIPWGQEWKERICNTLDQCTFFIPIITPSYLVSEQCRFELEYFLRTKEKKHILPILYINTPALEKKDVLAEEINKRQWEDWTLLRFKDLTSPKIGSKLEKLAKQIRELSKKKPTYQTPKTILENLDKNNPVKIQASKKQLVSDLEFIRISNRPPPPSSLPSAFPSGWEEIVWETDIDIVRNNVESPPRLIIISVYPIGSFERDKRRLKNIHGVLISYLGQDKFSLRIFDKDIGHVIDFPNYNTRICDEMLNRLKKVLGNDDWQIEEINISG